MNIYDVIINIFISWFQEHVLAEVSRYKELGEWSSLMI